MVFYDALKHPVDHIVSREGMTLQPSDFPIYEFLDPVNQLGPWSFHELNQ